MTATRTTHPIPGHRPVRQVLDVAAGALEVAEHTRIPVLSVRVGAQNLGHVAITTASGRGAALATALGLKLRTATPTGVGHLEETFDGTWGGVLMTVSNVTHTDGPVGEIPPFTSARSPR